MKYLSSIIICVSLLLQSSCKNEMKSADSDAQIPVSWSNVSVSEAKNDTRSVFLDVRTPEEVAEGMIDGALHIDVKNSDFKSEVDKLDKSKSYVVYCRSGARSQTASDIMLDLGFEEIYNMEGGYRAWNAE